MRATWTMATSGWTVAALYAGLHAMGVTASPTSWWVAAGSCFVFGVWLHAKGQAR